MFRENSSESELIKMRATIDTLSEDTCDSLYSDVSVAASPDDKPALVAMPSTVDTGTISTPDWVLVATFSLTLLWRSLLSTAPKNELESEEIRTDPMRAVPSEDPRFWNTPWSPPISLDRSTPTLDVVTLPIWDANSPRPAPAKNIPTANRTLRRSRETDPCKTKQLPTSTNCPTLMMRRGDHTAVRRVPTTENRIREIESGKS